MEKDKNFCVLAKVAAGAAGPTLLLMVKCVSVRVGWEERECELLPPTVLKVSERRVRALKHVVSVGRSGAIRTNDGLCATSQANIAFS